MLSILNLKHLKILLSTTIMMLPSCPVIVELSPDLAISFLDICLLNEWVLEEFRPGESLVWCLIQKTLEE